MAVSVIEFAIQLPTQQKYWAGVAYSLFAYIFCQIFYLWFFFPAIVNCVKPKSIIEQWEGEGI